MSKYTTRYPQSYWDPVIIKYIGLDTGKTYYKNYINKCLITKLNLNKDSYRYGRYDLDDELKNIIKDKTEHNYYWWYTSKAGLNRLLSLFRSDTPIVNTDIYTIKFDEFGKDIQCLAI